ncbi:MAG: hypothetical protein IRZ13_18945, partial [Acetobacteraceae bacterium]|nr:hypothetical protein [Acetobacteraceae bacterium]
MSDGGAALTYAFTFGHYLQKHGWTDVRSLSWDGLAALLTTHEVGPKAGTCIVPAVFAGGRRKKEYAVSIDVAFLDSDTGTTLGEAGRVLGCAAEDRALGVGEGLAGHRSWAPWTGARPPGPATARSPAGPMHRSGYRAASAATRARPFAPCAGAVKRGVRAQPGLPTAGPRRPLTPPTRRERAD